MRGEGDSTDAHPGYARPFTAARVTALNVSPEQIRAAREHAAAAGVSDLVELRETDYRNLEGRFDRVVSVGIMEYVGIGHFADYFGKICDLPTDDGYALFNASDACRHQAPRGPFIRR